MEFVKPGTYFDFMKYRLPIVGVLACLTIALFVFYILADLPPCP